MLILMVLLKICLQKNCNLKMKNMNYNMKYIVCSLFLLGLFACTDETEQVQDNQEQEVRVFGSVMSNSRVSFEKDDVNKVTHASWNNGDKIGLFTEAQKNLEYAVTTDGAGMVEFKPSSESLKCVDGTKVVAYYPHSASTQEMIVPLPNTSSYVWKDMKPFVYASDAVENSRVSLKFKHPFAYLKVTFCKNDLPDWATNNVLNTIEVSASGKNLGVVEGYFNLNTLQQTMTQATPVITVDADNFDLNASDFCCYIPVLPQGATQSLTFRFIQNNGDVTDVLFQCTKKASEEGLLAGYVYEVALNNEALPLSPDKIKTRLNEIGKEFVGNFNASEFNEVKNTLRYIKDTFCEEKGSTNTVTNWYEACLNAITKEDSKRDTTEIYDYSWSIDEYYYHYTDLTRLYAASQFLGHFTVKDNKWIKEDGDFNDMQFTAPGEDGKLCTVKLTTSGETKKIYIGETQTEDWYNTMTEYRDSLFYDVVTRVDSLGVEYLDTIGAYPIGTIYKYSSDIDVNTYQNYVYIPEKITIEYIQGSSQILKTVVTTDHSALKSDRYDVATEDLGVQVETFVNGFEFVMDKMIYGAGKNMEVSCKLNKRGMNLITLSASTDLAVTGDLYDNSSLDVTKCQNAVLSIDLIHQAQLKFSCSDGVKLEECMDKAEANDTDETIYKEQLAEINKLLSGGLYFDGQATRQAYVTVEAFQKTDWYGYAYWNWEPVMIFEDGSNYSLCSTFFNEDDFRSLINMAWDVADDFMNLANQFARNWNWD